MALLASFALLLSEWSMPLWDGVWDTAIPLWGGATTLVTQMMWHNCCWGLALGPWWELANMGEIISFLPPDDVKSLPFLHGFEEKEDYVDRAILLLMCYQHWIGIIIVFFSCSIFANKWHINNCLAQFTSTNNHDPASPALWSLDDLHCLLVVIRRLFFNLVIWLESVAKDIIPMELNLGSQLKQTHVCTLSYPLLKMFNWENQKVNIGGPHDSPI